LICSVLDLLWICSVLDLRCVGAALWSCSGSTLCVGSALCWTRLPNRKKVYVVKILPPPWGLPGAIWRLTPSHQPVGALDPPAVTSVSAPNMRSPIYDHFGVGPGARPVLGQVSPEGAGAQAGLGSSRPRFLAGGVPIGTSGSRGRPKERRPWKGKIRLKSWHSIQCGGHCRALALLLRRSRQSPCSG
jgi:hypothetical protein